MLVSIPSFRLFSCWSVRLHLTLALVFKNSLWSRYSCSQPLTEVAQHSVDATLGSVFPDPVLDLSKCKELVRMGTNSELPWWKRGVWKVCPHKEITMNKAAQNCMIVFSLRWEKRHSQPPFTHTHTHIKTLRSENALNDGETANREREKKKRHGRTQGTIIEVPWYL